MSLYAMYIPMIDIVTSIFNMIYLDDLGATLFSETSRCWNLFAVANSRWKAVPCSLSSYKRRVNWARQAVGQVQEGFMLFLILYPSVN